MTSLSPERVRKLLDYEPATGIFRWQITRTGSVTYGAVAGQHRPAITIDRRCYNKSQLAWVIVTGAWPIGRLGHLNDDKCDARWENLYELPISFEKWLAHYRRIASELPVGISYQNDRWFVVRVVRGGRADHIAVADTEREAKRLYLRASTPVFLDY